MQTDPKSPIPGLRPAVPGDIPALAALINLAFRMESFFKKGDRIDDQQVREKMGIGLFYVVEEAGITTACIYLELANEHNPALLAKGNHAGYIGMLAVDPAQQGRGLGKRLMAFAEAELLRRGCTRAQLRIINVRTELLDFYGRQGYRDTGTTSPYPYPEKTTMPVHFINLEKSLL